MKAKIFYLFLLLGFCFSEAQIAHYNQYPTMHVDTDVNLTGASFAYSLRILDKDYSGPIIKLRRITDNAVQDFYTADNEMIDVAAINAWAGGSAVAVDTWYDQSAANRNATQTNISLQPLLILTDPTRPEIKFDGVNDYLRVTNGNLQLVTNAGKEGSVFLVLRATKKSQYNFGAFSGGDRWIAHLNWSYADDTAYFDPGYCCSTVRSWVNADALNVVAQYTLISKTLSKIARVNQVEKMNTITDATACTRTSDFLIGAASSSSTGVGGNSNSSFIEFILFPIDVDASVYESIEQSEMNFWGL